MTVTFLAEIIKFIVPLPIPASIYGLILMFTAL
ncbi:CidA/LrgA family protein, partial [Akkermansia muciniphila]